MYYPSAAHARRLQERVHSPVHTSLQIVQVHVQSSMLVSYVLTECSTCKEGRRGFTHRYIPPYREFRYHCLEFSVVSHVLTGCSTCKEVTGKDPLIGRVGEGRRGYTRTGTYLLTDSSGTSSEFNVG